MEKADRDLLAELARRPPLLPGGQTWRSSTSM